MLTRNLGRTGLKVTAFCLGGNTFGRMTDQASPRRCSTPSSRPAATSSTRRTSTGSRATAESRRTSSASG